MTHLRFGRLLVTLFLVSFLAGCAVQAQMEFETGMDQLRSGRYEEAVGSFTQSLVKAPRFAQAYIRRGEAYHRLGQYDKSLEDYRTAIDLYPRDANAYYQRGQVFEEMGDHRQDALADFDKALELNPKTDYFWAARGNIYLKLLQFEKAVSDYDEAIRLNPKEVVPYSSRGNALLELRRLDEAIASYNKAIELQPKDALAWAGRGYAYLEKGEYEKALTDAEEAVRLNPYLGASYLTRGYAYIRARGDYKNGIADYTKAIELDREEAKRRGKKVSFFYAYVARADAYREIGELRKALVDADEAIEINPAYHLAFFSRGKIHQALGNQDQAAHDFNKGVELVSKAKEADAHTARAWLHMEQKKYDQAIASYRRAIDLEPESAEAYRGLANVYRAQKQYPQALEAYDKALSLEPSDPYAYSARAGLKVDMKRWAEAMEDLNRSLKLSPRFASGYYARAELHLARGDKAEALADYQKALEYAPDEELKKLAKQKIEKLEK